MLPPHKRTYLANMSAPADRLRVVMRSHPGHPSPDYPGLMPFPPLVEPVAALSESERARTVRHASLAGFGELGQRRLRAAHVAVPGRAEPEGGLADCGRAGLPLAGRPPVGCDGCGCAWWPGGW